MNLNNRWFGNRTKKKKMQRSPYYSQTGEDAYLNETIFKNKRNGIYIELGALDGVLYSNTKFYEDQLHWRGILIEPNPIQFEHLRRNRPNNLLHNCIVSCLPGPLKFKYFHTYHAAVSGVEDTLPDEHYPKYYSNEDCKQLERSTTTSIPTKTLTDIVRESGVAHIDLLSLDVEGHELEVLQSYDFKTPIHVVLIETLGTPKDQLCRELLAQQGYVKHSAFNHNEVYILRPAAPPTMSIPTTTIVF
jgi:FkbM family methyltransferase